jgi:acetolactate synthase-1/2/3 large subunit
LSAGLDGSAASSAGTTVAAALAEAIARAGTRLAFAFPGGGSNLALMAALEAEGVRVVLTRSETGGALMASAYGELTGRPGVAVVGIGPGVTSSANGIAHALLDRAPLLVVSDRYSEREAASSGHQQLDHERVLAPLTKWQRVLDAASARDVVAEALARAVTPPCGPVHLELARDVAGATAGAAHTRAPLAEPHRGDLDGAAATLAHASRPLLLVGHEAGGRVEPDALVAVAERLRAPVLSTCKAKGTLPESHPGFAGILTGAALERPLLERADAILAVGLDPVELLPRPWPAPAPLVALRADPAEDLHLRPRFTRAGDIAAGLAELADELGETRSEWRPDELAAARASLLAAVRVPASGSLASWQVVGAVQDELPDGATATVDAGAHMFAATWCWRAGRPGRFLISNGLATMGFAVPAAIAAALVRPEEPVVAFTGDGGFLLHAAELETAARLGARVLVVVLNDACLSLVRVKQEELGHDRLGVDFTRSDLALVAEGLGACGVRVRSEPELRHAVREALHVPATTVIDVALTGDEYGALHRAIRG